MNMSLIKMMPARKGGGLRCFIQHIKKKNDVTFENKEIGLMRNP